MREVYVDESSNHLRSKFFLNQLIYFWLHVAAVAKITKTTVNACVLYFENRSNKSMTTH